MNITNRTIMIDGLPVRYRMVGQGEPVVFIHGLSGSSRWWNRNVATISEHYQVYLLDLPGFGSMRHAASLFDLEKCAEWLDAWMQAVGLETIRLVGHSMGGYICMALAVLRPEKVKYLVLVDSIGIPFSHLQVKKDLRRYLLAKAMRSIVRTHPSFWPYMAYDYLRCGRAMLDRASNQIITLDAAAVITAVAVPTLLIWGANDDLVPLTLGRLLHAQLAGSRLLVLPQANHFCMFERPRDFNSALLAFFQGQEVGIVSDS